MTKLKLGPLADDPANRRPWKPRKQSLIFRFGCFRGGRGQGNDRWIWSCET
jgi:hypothetical protein